MLLMIMIVQYARLATKPFEACFPASWDRKTGFWYGCYKNLPNAKSYVYRKTLHIPRHESVVRGDTTGMPRRDARVMQVIQV